MSNSRKQSEDKCSRKSDFDDFEDVVETVYYLNFLILLKFINFF